MGERKRLDAYLDKPNHADLPSTVELSAVPFFDQRQQHCGAASLASMLAHRGIDLGAQDLEDYLFIPDKGGSLAIEMDARARQYGMLVYPLETDLANLLNELASGNPVLVLQNLGLAWWPQWHFAVLIGYDLEQNQLILRSGNEERYPVKLPAFINTWERAGQWARVIVQPSEVPVTANSTRFLKAAFDLEQVGKFAAAQTAYEKAVDHWSDKPKVVSAGRMALSNLALKQLNLPGAKNHLYGLLKQQASNSDAWNNLAYLLMQSACPDAAMSAIDCALVLQPGNPNYLDSRQELEAMSQASVSSAAHSNQWLQCELPACPISTR